MDDYDEGTDDFISTEGCFACQLNGRARRGRRKGRRRRYKRNIMNQKEAFLDVVSGKEGGNHRFKLQLVVNKEQTRNRQRILKLQPARTDLSKSVKYKLVSDDSGQLQIKRIAGIWGLFFKKRIAAPQNILAHIYGDPLKGPKFSDRYIDTFVNITVV